MILNKRKTYIFVGAWVIIFGFLLFFGPMRILRDIKMASNNLFLQRKAMRVFDLRIANFYDFEKNYSSFRPVIEKINNSFVNPEAPVNFVGFLEREAQNAGLLMDVNPSSVSEEEEFWKSVGFSITVGGSFPNCLRFLERLEESPWLVEILQMSVKRKSEEERSGGEIFKALSPGEVSLNIVLRTFSGEEPEED